MRDDRKRPWKKVRVVVEVTVPPNNRTTEKDLKYAVEQLMPDALSLPRPGRTDSREAAVRVKAFSAFYRAYKIIERNMKNASRN